MIAIDSGLSGDMRTQADGGCQSRRKWSIYHLCIPIFDRMGLVTLDVDVF
jgi:hypothetical protein